MMVKLSIIYFAKGFFTKSYVCYPTELKAGFTNDVNVMLEESNVETICVTVEGLTERPINDIVVNGESFVSDTECD